MRRTWPDGQPYTGAHWIYRGKRNAIYLRDRLRCVYCDADCYMVEQELEGFTLDHVRPMSLGGDKHSPRNLVTACMHCNRRKGNRPAVVLGADALYRSQLARRRQVPVNRRGLALLELVRRTNSRVAWALEAGWLDKATRAALVPELPLAEPPDDFIPW